MAEAKSSKKTGECKWFNSKKGFGFITPSDGSEEVFVHQSAIHAEGFRSLAEKEPVEYDTAVDDNGRIKALNVTGPGGAVVKGAPKPRPRFNNNRDFNGGSDNNGGGDNRGFRSNRGGSNGNTGGAGGSRGGFRGNRSNDRNAQ
jgi:cold shock CspA family protein